MELVEFGRFIGWIAAPENLLKTSIYVQNIQERQNTMIACIEEIVLEINGYQ